MRIDKPIDKPEVSVIVSTFNRLERFLKKAVKSVQEQTIKNIEIIVIDDASTDGTKDWLAQEAVKDKRIKWVSLAKNTGTDAHPKTTALKLAKSDLICYLDDDCEFLPYHIEQLLKRFKANPELDIAYGDMWLYDADKPEWEGQMGIHLNFDGQFLLNRNYIDFSMVMHKKEVAFAIGGVDERLPRFKDWNFFVRAMKWGATFQRVPVIITNYYTHKENTAHKYPVETWQDEKTGMTMHKPTFDPAGCPIYLPYLDNRPEEINPRVAIFTITYDRLAYTKRMYESMKQSTRYPFDWFVFDNGSKDGTKDWITKNATACSGTSTNKGITFASNYLIDKIMEQDKKITDGYQIIIKVDNDAEFMSKGWLETMVDLWKRNHLLYMSSYVEGLVHNPGGAPRLGYSYIGPYFVEVTNHIGGICAAIDKRAYLKFRWTDKFLHGNQDREASDAFRKLRYMPCYIPLHRVMHMDGTEQQMKTYPDYFKKRIIEKQTTYVPT